MHVLYPACGLHCTGHTSQGEMLTLCALHARGLNTPSHILNARLLSKMLEKILEKRLRVAMANTQDPCLPKATAQAAFHQPELGGHDGRGVPRYASALRGLSISTRRWKSWKMTPHSLFNSPDPPLHLSMPQLWTATCTRSATGLHPN